jgi:hypothetical protein
MYILFIFCYYKFKECEVFAARIGQGLMQKPIHYGGNKKNFNH